MPASPDERLRAYRSELLAKIGSAASHSDAASLLALAEDLRRTEALLARMEELDRETQLLLQSEPAKSVVLPRKETGLPNGSLRASGREHGVAIRASFLERAEKAGLTLRPYRGAIYRSPKGKRIGVAVATEVNRDRWFLGLQEGGFDAAVLVCARDAGSPIDVCLPTSFFEKFEKYLSRSGGQVKFNVARRDRRTILKLPGRTPEQVDSFIGAVAGLDV